MGMALQELLKSFCSDSEWTYAVFWKLKHDGKMILEWDNGVCDYPRPIEAVKSTSDFVQHNDLGKLSYLHYATDVYGGSSRGYSVGLAVADMSSLQYMWGEGLIGKAAYSGNHHWELFDDYFSSDTGFGSVSELPNEWLPQLVAGIKTILVAPVIPHGVLQLGSLERVAENMEVVNRIKDRFNSFHTVISSHFASRKFEMDILAHTSEPSMPYFMDNSDESLSKLKIHHDDCRSEATIGSCSIASIWENTHIFNQALHPSVSLDTLKDIEKDLPPLHNGAFGNKNLCRNQEARLFDESLDAIESTMDSFHFESLVTKEKSWVVSQSGIANTDDFGETSDRALQSFFSEDMMKHASGVGKVNGLHNADATYDFTLPVPSHQQLAKSFSSGTFEAPFEDPYCKMSDDKNLSTGEPLAWKSGEWVDEGYGNGYLLEAVVANASAGKSRSLPDISENVQASTYAESLYQCETSTLAGDDFIPRSNVASDFVAEAQNKYSDSSSLTSFNNMISTLISKEQQSIVNHGMQPRHRASNKKKTRAVDNRKPRPRDRQLMQDHLTQLRQLVPNGTKFTIDGLLEQTVKHILFLRSVTSQAEKVKMWTNRKVTDDREYSKKRNSQNGRSWALELGNEDPTCPIMVEDLDVPGLLLIEILCNEEGRFLETAQVIVQSGLSILKGEMENHADNKWAKFIVQATKDFHRMDIFWPLMQLIQGKTTLVD